MVDRYNRFQVQTHIGQPVSVGDLTLTPQSVAYTLRWPNGGFVWNRPVSVFVEGGQGGQRFPVVDVTLLAQVALFGLALAFGFAMLGVSLSRRRK